MYYILIVDVGGNHCAIYILRNTSIGVILLDKGFFFKLFIENINLFNIKYCKWFFLSVEYDLYKNVFLFSFINEKFPKNMRSQKDEVAFMYCKNIKILPTMYMRKVNWDYDAWRVRCIFYFSHSLKPCSHLIKQELSFRFHDYKF